MNDTRPKGPFSDILVVDLTRVLAGPYCALLMAELGARVIKIEPPRHGDDSRMVGPFHQDQIRQDQIRLFPFDQSRQGIDCARSEGRGRPQDLRCAARARRRADRELPRRHDGEAGLRLGDIAGTLSAIDLRRHFRLRPYGALCATTRLRHGRAGDGRDHEPHRPSRQPAHARRLIDRRSDGRIVRAGRHFGGALRPHENRPRHEGRYLHAGLPGGDPGERDRALCGDGRCARTARQPPSFDRAVRRPMRRRTAIS
jgi:hypothetical protein